MQFNLDLILDVFQIQFIRDLIREGCFTVNIQKTILICWAIKWDGWKQDKLKKKIKEVPSIFTHLYCKQEIITQFETYCFLIGFYAVPSCYMHGKKIRISSPGLVDKKQQPSLTLIQEEAATCTPFRMYTAPVNPLCYSRYCIFYAIPWSLGY